MGIGFNCIKWIHFRWTRIFPQFSENVISIWFKERILDIEKAVLIGFIFKVIGFFFLIGMFSKMLNALNYIISRKTVGSGKQ